MNLYERNQTRISNTGRKRFFCSWKKKGLGFKGLEPNPVSGFSFLPWLGNLRGLHVGLHLQGCLILSLKHSGAGCFVVGAFCIYWVFYLFIPYEESGYLRGSSDPVFIAQFGFLDHVRKKIFLHSPPFKFQRP